jgi:aryl-alcohol dehydrogenase-like predicted oxidoreductase
MELRDFGRTGLKTSILGFGCGAVGGLMVRGSAADQEHTVGQALDAGVNYFDTAVQYGDGVSETNLGRVLKTLKPKEAIVGTKVRVPPAEFGRIAAAITKSLEDSLKRLGMTQVDIFHLHNPVTQSGGGETLSTAQVMGEVVPTFQKLQAAGKLRFLGFTGVGDTASLQACVDSKAFSSIQAVYNMLNPSASAPLPKGAPGQDYAGLFAKTQAAGVGVVGIRVLAGGALSGSAERHPIASPPPAPIGSAASYEADIALARKLSALVTEGHAASLPEAATRFAISHPAMGSILVGMAQPSEFDDALAAVRKGPMSVAGLARLAELQRGFAG